MPSLALNEIEDEFERLSPEAQISLLQRLLRRVRVSGLGHQNSWEGELAAMATDPQIRREIDSFHGDTLVTEADGLRGD